RARLVDLVVRGNVRDEVPDQREGGHGLAGGGPRRVVVRETRLAGQAGPPVDLGTARPAFRGLAVPADGEVGSGVGLDPMKGVENDHPLLDRHLELGVGARLLRRAAEDPHQDVRHQAPPPASASVRSSFDIAGSFDVPPLSAPPSRRTTTLRPAHFGSVAGKSSRLCAPRLSWRASALRAIASEISIRFRTSKTRFQPGLKARPPVVHRSSARRRMSAIRAIAPSRSVFVRKIPTSTCIVSWRSSRRRYGSTPPRRVSGASSSASAARTWTGFM